MMVKHPSASLRTRSPVCSHRPRTSGPSPRAGANSPRTGGDREEQLARVAPSLDARLHVEQGHAHRAGPGAHELRGQQEVVGARLREAIARLELHPPREEALEDGPRTGRSATHHQLEPGEVHRLEARVALQLDEHGGHPEQQADDALVHQVEHLLDGEGAADDAGPAHVDERRGEDIEPPGVEEGRVEQRGVLGRQSPAHHGVGRVGGDGAVREDGRLGRPVLPPRIAKHPRVPGLHVHGRRRRVRERLALAELRPLQCHHVPHPGHERTHRLHLGLEVRAVQQHRGLGVGEQAHELRDAQPPVERLEEGAQLAAREEQIEQLGAVHRQDGHTISLPHTSPSWRSLAVRLAEAFHSRQEMRRPPRMESMRAVRSGANEARRASQSWTMGTR